MENQAQEKRDVMVANGSSSINNAPIVDPDVQKYLYEFTIREYDKMESRWESADTKASNFTPILGLLLGAAGFFGNWLLQEKMLPPDSVLDWCAFLCITLAFVSILTAWLFVLKSVKVRSINIVEFNGDPIVDFFLKRDVPTIHTGMSYRFARDTQDNKAIVDRKLQLLIYAHYGILIAAVLLTFLLICVGCHGWQINQQIKALGMAYGII